MINIAHFSLSLRSLLLIIAFSSLYFSARAEGQVIHDFFRSQGKIYVVVAVIIVLFIGIVAYLISLDRKLSKIENRIKHE